MCCLITVLGLLGPRAAIFFWWLFDPARWNQAFHGFYLWPILGFVFLPWTTLAWVVVAPHGIAAGFDWLIVVIGFLFDLAMWTGGGYGNRRRFARAGV